VPIDIDRCRGPDALPDNWKVAYEWFLDAERSVDRGASITRLATHYQVEDRKFVEKKNLPLRGKNPLVFYSDRPKALINYADNIEKDGYLDEISILAWRRAGQEWNEYGDRQILTSWGMPIRLNDLEFRLRESARLTQALAELLPGLEQQLVDERRRALSDEETKLLDKDPAERSAEETQRVQQLEEQFKLRPIEIADRAPANLRRSALQLAQQLEEHTQQAEAIRRYREIVNFENWRLRCEAEQQPNTLAARKKTFDAERAFEEAQLEKARDLFEQAWDRWSEFFQNYPIFIDDVEGEIVVESVVKYKKLLDQLNEPFPPAGFKLMALIKSHEIEYPEIAPPASADTSPPGEPDPPPANPPSSDSSQSPSVSPQETGQTDG
jgi:hypothetical protein